MNSTNVSHETNVIAVSLSFREALSLTEDDSILSRAARRWPNECDFQWARNLEYNRDNVVHVSRSQFQRLLLLRRRGSHDHELMDELSLWFSSSATGIRPQEMTNREIQPISDKPLFVDLGYGVSGVILRSQWPGAFCFIPIEAICCASGCPLGVDIGMYVASDWAHINLHLQLSKGAGSMMFPDGNSPVRAVTAKGLREFLTAARRYLEIRKG